MQGWQQIIPGNKLGPGLMKMFVISTVELSKDRCPSYCQTNSSKALREKAIK